MAFEGEIVAAEFGGGFEESMRTQISAKYSLDNPGVFDFRQQVVEAGLDVRFPAGPEIIEHSCGFAITVPEEATVPFYKTEIDFLRAIKSNHLQIGYNIYGDNEGYVGESSGLETAYALLLNKPVIMLREPNGYSPTIAEPIRDLIERYKGLLLVEDVDKLGKDALTDRLAEVAASEVDYGLTSEDAGIIMREAVKLARKYRYDWNQYLDLQAEEAS